MAKTLADLYMMHPLTPAVRGKSWQFGEVTNTPNVDKPDKPDKPDDKPDVIDPNFYFHDHGRATRVALGAPVVSRAASTPANYAVPGLSLAALFGYGR